MFKALLAYLQYSILITVSPISKISEQFESLLRDKYYSVGSITSGITNSSATGSYVIPTPA